MIKKAEIITILSVVILLGVSSLARAEIVSLDLFDLGCQEFYDFNSPLWTTSFDLGVTFIEISHVYIDWSGEITAGLAYNPYMPDPQPCPCEVGLLASLGSNPGARLTDVYGGALTYPEPEGFDYQSEFELFDPTTWSDLLDGQGTIQIYYNELIILGGRYIEHGAIVLNSASIIVDGVLVPEPATILFLAIGGLFLTRQRR